jgi:hypothetical protein
MGILSCNIKGNDVDISPTPKFILIPHIPGEAPMVPHPMQLFEDCVQCHIDTSNIGSFIKVHKEHSCDECHMNLDYEGPCLETEPPNLSCAIDVCHLYPKMTR